VAQQGVFALEQMRPLGMAAATVRARLATGRVHRIHQTLYSLVPRSC
jgi:hypothetical protein